MQPVPTPDPALRDAVLAWYDVRGRSLSFRGTRDPYRILLAETMAQQTQVSRVTRKWERFLERFPDVASLAAATPADVLREWRGLGYNLRALHLWRAARAVVEEHGGILPREVAALEALPGIGPYTARAVAAIAYGHPVGAVDTNVRRVLGRVLTGSDDRIPPRPLQRMADASVAPDRAGDWTHAVMDLGATLCRPRLPRCDDCPARPWCRYAAGSAAGRLGRAAAGRRVARTPFPATNRWLRGRILDRLRLAPGTSWVELEGPIGDHPETAIRRALAGLARDGLIELAPGSGLLARLPLDDADAVSRG